MDFTDKIFAVDPGTEQSAWVLYDPEAKSLRNFGMCGNSDLRNLMCHDSWGTHFVFEMIASYGMPVGAEVFETCVWIGRFIESIESHPHSRVFRKEVKLHLCNSPRAKDSNVRQALIDRFGPGKDKAIGLKASPGPLYGVKKDIWAALAVAITFAETR